jgi:hypothetical protein
MAAFAHLRALDSTQLVAVLGSPTCGASTHLALFLPEHVLSDSGLRDGRCGYARLNVVTRCISLARGKSFFTAFTAKFDFLAKGHT